MKISQIGEDQFIQRIKEKMGFNIPLDVIGIEDDCAVVPFNNDKHWLLSTDSLVEGCHFLKDKISPQDLGYKAVMANVSDIAAMGGKGLYVLMSIALPNDTEESWLNDYLTGVKDACLEASLFLIGGDTTGSKSGIFINFTIMGEVDKANVKYRRDARVGDLICLTAPIGNSLAGFHALMQGETKGPLVEKHCHPKAQFNEGFWLGTQSSVHAMMDLSDGLQLDLERMVKAANVGAEVVLEQIPLSKEFLEFSQVHSWDARQQAVVSGEEYCLLLTVDPEEFKELNSEFMKQFSYPLFVIGSIKSGAGVNYIQCGSKVSLESKGYNHFNYKNEN